MTSQEKWLVVSSDGHAGMRFKPSDPWEQLKAHMERRYAAELDRYAEHVASQVVDRAPGGRADPMGSAVRARRAQATAVKEGGDSGLFDPIVRSRQLDADGIAGEVIFPQAIPFKPLGNRAEDAYPYEYRLAGVRAYNRWLAEFCSYEPERHAGVAQVLTDNIDDAVEDVRWARKAGLFGGVQLPLLPLYTNERERFYHHERFEPLWSVCEELDMPLLSHVGGFTPDYGPIESGSALRTFESIAITAHRNFWFMLFSGALRRHPGLKLVFTESGGTWVPYTVDLMDEMCENRNPELMREVLGGLRPSEYWARQCYIGASPPSGRREIEQRYRIGVGNLMWGSDFPHPEGTWPFTRERLEAMFTGVPEHETRQMVADNAIRVFGFDKAKLSRIAQRIGPTAISRYDNEPLSAVEYARLWATSSVAQRGMS